MELVYSNGARGPTWAAWVGCKAYMTMLPSLVFTKTISFRTVSFSLQIAKTSYCYSLQTYTLVTTAKHAMSSTHEGTTLKQKLPKQEQDLPGSQAKMEPEPFSTKLETGKGPKPYVGVGKLKGKKALITGGEWVVLYTSSDTV